MAVSQERLFELLDGYLEQRLSEADLAALNAELVTSSEARRLFWAYAHQHALLGELLAEARGVELAAQEQAILPLPQRPRKSAWLRIVGSAVAASLVLALFWVFRPSPGPVVGPIGSTGQARLGEVHGEVHVGTSQVAQSGQVVQPGQEIRTGEGSSAVVMYEDSSRLEINADTTVRMLDGEVQRKGVFLVQGSVSATVTQQPDGRPMILRTGQAEVSAANTRFSSASLLGETRIEVEEGRALLSLAGESRSIEVQTGIYAVATNDTEVQNSGPMLPTSSKPSAVLEDASGPVLGLALAKPGASRESLAVACWNGQVKLWDVRTHRVHGILDANRKRAVSVASSPDGSMLAVGYEPGHKNERFDSAVLVWDVLTTQVVRSLPGTRKAPALAFAGKDVLVLAHPEKNQRGVQVWDLPKVGQRDPSRERLVLGNERAEAIAVAALGNLLASGYRDGKIRLWDIDTGRLVACLEGHQREVQALTFQAGGTMLASGSRDGSVRLWDVASGAEVRKLTGKFGEVRCLAFAPDGQTLASGHAGAAILWDLKSGQQQSTLKSHKFAITAMVYLDGGRTLATAGWDRSVKLWALQPAGDGI